jgi:HTH-type transcriptional repressor of NAD biosynthesis genes
MPETIGMYGGKFLPPHMGHIYASTKASTKVDKLYIIVCYNRKLDKEYCESSKDIPHIPGEIRVRMMRQIFKDLPHVEVVGISDREDEPDLYEWDLGAVRIKNAIGEKIDYIFGSEPEYSEYFSENFPGSEYITIDQSREFYPISATDIRRDGVFSHWNFIPNEIKKYFVKKIVLVGTESCGKSTMTRNLARLYNTNCVSEYGRDVCEWAGGDQSMIEQDFLKIAENQRRREDEACETANKITFIDTETIITQYYSELILGKRIPLLDAIIDRQKYDLWLYLEPDVPWVNDGTRNRGEQIERENNNHFLKGMLNKRGIEYHCINGDYYERLEKIFRLVNELRYYSS